MQTASSLALSIGLVLSAVPAAAESGIASTAGPITRAIAREGSRLAMAPQVGNPSESDWARVRQLPSSTEVNLTLRGLQVGGIRYVVLSSDHDVTVLNLTNSTVPRAAKSVLLDVARHHPTYFAATQVGDAFLLDKNARIGRAGVFVADQKIADFADLVERIERADVLQVEGPIRSRGSVAGAVMGVGGGLLIGTLAFVFQGFRDDCSSGCNTSNALVVMGLVGLPVAGGILGYRLSSHETPGVIYRAP